MINPYYSPDSPLIVHCKTCGDPLQTQRKNAGKEFECAYCRSTNVYPKWKFHAEVNRRLQANV